MIAGSDMARIVSEVNIKQLRDQKSTQHEPALSTQNRFARNVKSVVETFNE